MVTNFVDYNEVDKKTQRGMDEVRKLSEKILEQIDGEDTQISVNALLHSLVAAVSKLDDPTGWARDLAEALTQGVEYFTRSKLD
jgi:hypothetical protein